MKLKRILYCILSLVVVLSFLPGCELFLKEPKKPKNPKKEWPCDVVPQEPPTEYGNFMAFKLNGIPFAYANCPTYEKIVGILNREIYIQNDSRWCYFQVREENTAKCNRYLPSMGCSFIIPDAYVLGESFRLRGISVIVDNEKESTHQIKTGAYTMVEGYTNEIRLISYDKCTGMCRGHFSAVLASKKLIPDPNDPDKKILVPSDTIQLTDGVISMMTPDHPSLCN